jgi:hypothetical protein
LSVCSPRVVERDAGARDEIVGRRAHEHLVAAGERCDPPRDMDRDPAQLLLRTPLDLAGLHARTDVQAERLERAPDLEGRPDRPRGTVEGSEEAVAGRVDLLAGEAAERAAHPAWCSSSSAVQRASPRIWTCSAEPTRSVETMVVRTRCETRAGRVPVRNSSTSSRI